MGLTGRIAGRFLHSRLTPLIAVASLAAGVLALIATPREEEPQISVPMIDVIAALPGAPPSEVENLLTGPLEQRMWEIPSVEHVYSTSGEGWAMVTVRFKVGEDQERSVTRVQAKLASDLDQLTPGTVGPVVRPHSIDDVPILTLTVTSRHYDSNQLRQLAIQLADETRTAGDVAAVSITGGEAKQIRVELDPVRLSAAGVTPGEVAQALRGANVRLDLGEAVSQGRVLRLAAGAPLTSAAEIAEVIVSRAGQPVALGDVAAVREEFGEPASYVSSAAGDSAPENAVTISIAKRHGANATLVARHVLERVEQARGRLLPPDVSVLTTRNYGETAREKAAELILHLGIATLSVTLLVGIFLGWREAVVVLVAVPVTLALTLFSYYALGYTLNRITLFALIFSIGILVDDAIVVVENINRHLKLGRSSADGATVEGVDEVGNPTILATFTVIAAILPMAFVSGLMGPYMRPIPVGASVAMLASLAVAFIITPYLGIRLLRNHPLPADHQQAAADGRFARIYRPMMRALMQRKRIRLGFFAGVAVLLLGSMLLVALRVVQVKMLPFDNKSEFQVILDFPEGTPLETSARAAGEIGSALRRVPEVRQTQVYAGIAAPFNFNGLVRHYFLRRGSNIADIQVNLTGKGDRARQSHAIASGVRAVVDSLARRYGARARIAEIPPGPPVLATLVAEIYGANDSLRLETARRVKQVFEATPGVVDVDWTVEDPQSRLRFRVDRSVAAAAGIRVEDVVRTVYLAQAGSAAGIAPSPTAREGIAIQVRLPLESRAHEEALLSLPVPTREGPQPLGRFVRLDSTWQDPTRFRRDLRPLIYVTGDVAGRIESPVYAILAMNRILDTVTIGGVPIARFNAVQPDRLDQTAIKWDGEWQITIEVFRDLGLAFAVVLALIYVLVVWWFESFGIPLVIMAPIPLTLIGILPGHALTGAFFTATSMIGMIALAGIIVRNSILLVDFIQLAERKGLALEDAVIEAGAVRFRPIALTGAAVVVGGLVMVLDPIFQGLAVALISGAIVATLLTMIVVPLTYWMMQRGGVVVR